jgi:hypothetical protein
MADTTHGTSHTCHCQHQHHIVTPSPLLPHHTTLPSILVLFEVWQAALRDCHLPEYLHCHHHHHHHTITPPLPHHHITTSPHHHHHHTQVWQAALRECHRADPNNNGHVSRVKFITALTQGSGSGSGNSGTSSSSSSSGTTLSPAEVNRLADNYELSNGELSHLNLTHD